MIHYAQPIDNESLLGILRRTCGYVDIRLMEHGMRVAQLTAHMLAVPGTRYTPRQQRNACFVAVLHDVGAYKTEEVDHLLRFETGPVWEHSVYGSLFLKYFSPFSALSSAVLFHHAPYSMLEGLGLAPDCSSLAALLHLADRADLLFQQSREDPVALLGLHAGTEFSPRALALLHAIDLPAALAVPPETDPLLLSMLCSVPFSPEEVDACLQMLIFAIDFRSRHTVTHTMTTASVSGVLAQLLGLSETKRDQIVCGALLHDLGKIGIPVEILEYPGKLSPQAMEIMRTHVALTEKILGDSVAEPVKRIALRHHEKLDGSGYPLGLRAEALTTEERVVAVADIVSALCGTRSYKEAYPKERVLELLAQQSAAGHIDPEMVALTTTHFDAMMDQVSSRTQPILAIYATIKDEYAALMGLYGAV
ncbi:MAG: HD domain-containing protein [Pseudoflavonifractor sp.]